MENLYFDIKNTKDKIAKMLKTTPDMLDTFEQSYSKLLTKAPNSDNFFDINAKQMARMQEGIEVNIDSRVEELITRIVDELVNCTPVWSYDGSVIKILEAPNKKDLNFVTNAEINEVPELLRPQLTGTLYATDMKEPSYIILLDIYRKYLEEDNIKQKKLLYHNFRQGLDILDLDSITYQMIDTNPNSMSHWLPQLTDAVQKQNFFKIPKTTIIKVPLPLLQLTRLEYQSLTRTTLDIVDRFCYKVFNLKEDKEYFIKTGTYSSKFDFRNAYVHGEKEVRELGEYLLFIHHQASQMAAPLNNKSIYGASTTTEWVVREFIQDVEKNPCIYKGLPLHTEYRIFVDFDTKEILGITPYWDANIMKKRFGHQEDAMSPHNIHDYIIYTMHEDVLMDRYQKNQGQIKEKLKSLIKDVENLNGQWSIDIMQNGNNFWIIDMALAATSALNHCVPKNLLKKYEENWLPKLDC